jgi:ubiquinone/menaquinone biosynthesis C-methylase UbiE
MSSVPYFNQIAGQWDDMRQAFFSDRVREAALAAATVQPGELAADIGAGSGFVTEALIAAGLTVKAVDPSAQMLEVMREKFAGSPSVDYRLGDAEQIPLEASSVKHTFANMCLHHVENPPAAIREMARILQPGGKLVITDLDTHDFAFLRDEQQDRWMGFARTDIAQWFTDAGLIDVSVTSAGSNCCADSACGTQRAEVSIFLAVGTQPVTRG